jgi:dUTP pyrophosphatase
MKVNIKKITEEGVIPSYSRNGDAGLDLTATSFSIENDCYVYGTGIAIEIPEGYVGLIYPRSSISKYDLILANHVGVIDSNYRGELILKFKKTKTKSKKLNKIYIVGDRIGQLIIMAYPSIEFSICEDLSSTNRNTANFGSSGE